MEQQDIQSNHDFSRHPQKTDAAPGSIKVIGVGGGGGNAVNHMYRHGDPIVSFIVANTDRQALNNSPVPNKVLLGPSIAGGRGAGNKPDVAREAAEESAAEIAELLSREHTDMVFITAGMGGGTGTGASPVIARIAREQKILTIGIVTIPFLFEGQKKIIKALDGAKEMSRYVDALMVINNERLSEIYRDMNFLNAFRKADDILAMAAMSISEIITSDGYINLDFNDVNSTLRDGGTAIISTGYGEGENRVTKAINDALNSPLLRNTDIFGSKRILFNLYFNPDAEQEFKIDETNQITSFINNIDPNVDIIWGVHLDPTLGDKVKFTILAAGFDVSVSENADGPVISTGKATETRTDEEVRKEKERLAEAYGREKIEETERIKTEQRFIILQPDQIDDDEVIKILESTPAFNRDKRIITGIKAGMASRAKESADTAANAPSAARQQSSDSEIKASSAEVTPGQNSAPGNSIDFSDLL